MCIEGFFVEIFEAIHAAYIYASTLESVSSDVILLKALAAIVAGEHDHLSSCDELFVALLLTWKIRLMFDVYDQHMWIS